MRHLLRRSFVTGIAIATALVVASPASAADKTAGTLTIPDKGSSDILGWSWGVTSPVTIGGSSGGAGAGKVTFSDFNLTKRVNPLSTELFRATASGTQFPEVTISVPIGGPGTPFTIDYKLRTVFVSSFQQSGSAGEATESVSLTYGALQQNVGTNSQFGFDIGN